MSSEKKIKVAFVLGALNRGGAENLVLDICRSTNNTLYEYTCLYRKDGNMTEEFKRSNIHLIHQPKQGNLLQYMWQIRQLLLRKNIDIVHSQTASNTLLLSLLLLGTRIKIITTIHGFSTLNNNELYKQIVFNASKRIIFVSHHQMNEYIRNRLAKYKNKSQVIYNGIDSSKFEHEFTIPDIYIDKGNVIKICVVGNIRQARTYDVIINAINHLHTEGVNNIRLFIIGNCAPEERGRLEYYKRMCKEYKIEDIVHIVGGRGDIPDVLKYSDIYVMSSIETFGISIVEAMMSGIPVIVNDYEVMREITENAKLGLLYQTNNYIDLANTIKKVVNNIEYYQNEAESRKDYVKAKYSIDNCINQLNALYSSILNE